MSIVRRHNSDAEPSDLPAAVTGDVKIPTFLSGTPAVWQFGCVEIVNVCKLGRSTNGYFGSTPKLH